jgi:hypothetical protein
VPSPPLLQKQDVSNRNNVKKERKPATEKIIFRHNLTSITKLLERIYNFLANREMIRINYAGVFDSRLNPGTGSLYAARAANRPQKKPGIAGLF